MTYTVPRRHAGWLAALALAAATIAVYAAGLHGPFLLDDADAIFPLLAAQSTGADWLEILRAAPHHVRSRWVANATFLLSQAGAAGPLPSAFAFKAGNLAIHLATALVLGALAQALALRWGATRARALAIALLAAGIFALHPLLVSTVLYSVQRMAQLATLFSLLSVFSYLRWRERIADSGTAAHVLGLSAVAGFAVLAFFSKESGALVPLLIGVVELTAFRWPPPGASWRSRFDTGFGLFCAAPIVLGLVTLALRWPGIVAGFAGRDFTLATRLLTEIHVLAGYLAQIAWPRLAGMGLYHDELVPVTSLQPSTLLLALAFLAASAAAVALRRRWPALAFGVLWFLAAHALESSVIALELVFEHRNYLAIVGPAIAVAWLLARAGRVAGTTLALLVLAGLATQTARRATDWSDFDRWIATEARRHPGSLRAATDLFFAHVAAGRTSDAVATRERMLADFPASAQPVLLKLAFACRGPLAFALFERDELRSLGSLHVGKDGYHVFSGARQRIRNGCQAPDWPAFAAASQAVAANPAIAAEPRAAAAWWRANADANLQQEQWPAVREALRRVLSHDREDPRDWLLLAEAELRLGDPTAYRANRERAMQLAGPRAVALADEIARLDALEAAAGMVRP